MGRPGGGKGVDFCNRREQREHKSSKLSYQVGLHREMAESFLDPFRNEEADLKFDTCVIALSHYLRLN